MRVHVADSFLASVARLQGRSAADVKRAAFDFLTAPDRPGLHLHRLVHAIDRGFWSLRAGRDLRVIVHRSGGDVVLCYAARHDEAYAWAAGRLPGGATAGPASVDVDVGARAGHDTPPCVAERVASAARRLAVQRQPGGPPASPRSQRLRQRALAPLAVAARAAEPGRAVPPPLLELLRFVRQAEPGERPARAPTAPGDAPGGRRPTSPRLASAIAVTSAALSAAAIAALAGAGIAAAIAEAALALLLAAAVSRLQSRAGLRVHRELERAAARLRAGHLDARLDPAGADAALRPVVEQANAALDAATAPALALGAAVSALSRGEPPDVGALPAALAAERTSLALLGRFLAVGPDEIRRLVSRCC